MRIFKKLKGVPVFLVVAGLLLLGVTSSGYAEEKSPWMVRVRALALVPDDSSSQITQIGGEAEVDDAMSLDLDFSYFFTDHFATELTLILANHDVEAKNTAVGDVDLGDVWVLPPTLTFQYHFLPNAQFRPYVGAGLSLVLFLWEDEGPVATSIDYDDEIGYALQAGFDWGIDDHWAINFDVKYVWVSTDVSVSALGTVVNTEVDINPWLFGVGIAYRF